MSRRKVSVVLGISVIFLLSIGKCQKLPKCCPFEDHEYMDGKCVFHESVRTELTSRYFEKFQFVEGRPECVDSLVWVTLSEHNVGFSKNSYFKLGDIYYPPEQYCINRIKSDGNSVISLSIWICDPICSDSNPCFAKCCPPDQVLEYKRDRNDTVCSPSGSKFWSPFIHDDINSSLPKSQRFNVSRCIMSSQMFHYSNNDIPGFRQKQIRILKNGSVSAYNGKEWILFDNDFCIDGVLNNEDTNSSLEFSGNPGDTALLENAIRRPTTNRGNEITAKIYKGAFLVSAIFLLFSITVYISLWETRKSVYWLTQLSYFVSLLFMYLFLASAFILPKFVYLELTDEPNLGCFIIGVLAHFFFVCTFCWMTTINLHIWSTIGSLEKMIVNSRSTFSRLKHFKKYFWYAAFSITIPVIIVGTAVILDIHARGHGLITPDYGRERCYIKENSLLPYLYGPIGILLIINFIIYLVTVAAVIRFKHIHTGDMVPAALKKSSKANPNPVSERRQSLILFAKLFLIMGIFWVLELIGWGYGDDCWVWKAFDVLNILQPILIFFVFICKGSIFRELRGKYACFNELLTSIHISLGTLETSSTSPATTSTSIRSYGGRIQKL